MTRRIFMGACAAVGIGARGAQSQFVPVLTRSYDNLRSGANVSEIGLPLATVASRGMRKYFSLLMEGDARGAEAQPLFIPGVVTQDGRTHNMVVACSMNNTIHAYDADDSAELWTQRIARPVDGGRSIDMFAINDHWGILSTPVIEAETQTLYCVAWSSPDGTPQKGAHSIHAISLIDGRRAAPPVSLQNVSYKGKRFADSMRKQRCSLTMTNVNGVKTVFFAAGSVFESAGGNPGWIIAYDIASNKVSAALATTVNYGGGGIWMAGQGLTADQDGYLYGVTGNGSFDAKTEWGECFFKAKYTPGPAAKIEIVDWFSPYSDTGRIGMDPTAVSVSAQPKKMAGTNAMSMKVDGDRDPVNSMSAMVMDGKTKLTKGTIDPAFADQDLGSSGINYVPELGIVFGSGKDGVLYVMNAASMGRTKNADFANPAANYARLKQPPIFYTYYQPGSSAPADITDLDVLFGGKTHHMHSTSVVWKSPAGWRAYCWGENGNLRCWGIYPDGRFQYLGCGAEIASANVTKTPGGMPGGMMCLSANGVNDAVLWACVPQGDANKEVSRGNVYAYDAYNIGKYADGSGALRLIWKSPDYTYNKFCPPVVNGGKLFVTTYDGKIDVYGLA